MDNFIGSLRDEVRILKQLPPRLKRRVEKGLFYSLPPVSWSNISYYENQVFTQVNMTSFLYQIIGYLNSADFSTCLSQILPLILKHKVVHLNRTDARLANNGLPLETQRLRCRVNFDALRFTSQIEELGRKIVKILRQKGPFLVLHLRYEMDMLAFSGCTQGCDSREVEELTRMRYVESLNNVSVSLCNFASQFEYSIAKFHFSDMLILGGRKKLSILSSRDKMVYAL